MKGEIYLMSLANNLIKLAVEVVKHLKKQQVSCKCYRPRLCYVCRRQGHLARSCPDQAKYERQEHSMDVRFMKTVDSKGGNYENRRRIRKSDRGKISNETVKNKSMQMKSGTIPVKTIGGNVEAVEPKNGGVKKNVRKTFIYHQKSSNMSNPDGIGGKMQRHKAFDYYRKPTDMVDCDVINTYVDCYPSGVETEKVDQVHIDRQMFFSSDNSDETCNRNEPIVVMEVPLGEVLKIDAMMKGLLESLTKDECDIKGINDDEVIKVHEDDNDKRNMMVNSISMDEILKDDVKLNDIPEVNSRINSIKDVGETSNDEDGMKYDLEMKIENDDYNENVKTVIEVKTENEPMTANDEMIMRKGTRYAKLIGYNHNIKRGWNRSKVGTLGRSSGGLAPVMAIVNTSAFGLLGLGTITGYPIVTG
ncbi:hypothetical protein C2G38_2141977 [Gigaspora rosea]|uniref:CCHC-type domain-containing protein n=1 Tax=Gigaspora rosea TaxID=44941 RepID=A0A397V8H4_9GLOM|nr:hypothetical protein C2G38_2141977 [Gigaspora rosea]